MCWANRTRKLSVELNKRTVEEERQPGLGTNRSRYPQRHRG